MSKRITIEFPFAGSLADVEGFYTPKQQGCMYMYNGDPGDAPWPSEFEVDSFYVGEETDILEELNEMYVKDHRGNYISYIDSINDKLCEIADEQWNAMNADF